MVVTSIRLPKDVLAFYRKEFGSHMQLQMRAVLTTFANDMQVLASPNPQLDPNPPKET